MNIVNHRNTPTFNDLTVGMKTAIAEAVDNACDITNDMSVDDITTMNIGELRRNAATQLQLALDPDVGSIELPLTIVEAMNEYIDLHVHFQLKFY